MSDIQKFTKDVGWIATASLLTGLIGIFLLPIITKILGAHAYGIWSQVGVTIGLVSVISGLGLGSSIIRFLAAEKDKKNIQEIFYSTIASVFFVSLIASFLLILFSNSIASSLFDGATNIVMIIAFIIPISCINAIYLAFFKAFRQMKTFSIFTFVKSCITLGLVFYMVLSGYGIFGAVISLLICEIIIFFIVFSLITPRIGIKLPHFSEIKPLLYYALPLVPTNLVWWIVASSDRYIIAYFLGVTSVGFYSAGYGLGIITQKFILPIEIALTPTLSKLYDEGRIDDVKIYLRYSLKYFLMLGIPSFFGLSVLSKQILSILTTPEIALNAYLVTPIVVLGAILWGSYAVIYMPILLAKKTSILGVVWGIAAFVNLSLNIIIVPYIGILGAAITTLITYAMVLVIGTHFSFKYLKFDIDWLFILKSIAASIIMSLIIWYISPIQLLDLLLWIGIGAGIYAAILFLLKGFTREELKFFRELFRV